MLVVCINTKVGFVPATKAYQARRQPASVGVLSCKGTIIAANIKQRETRFLGAEVAPTLFNTTTKIPYYCY